MGTSGNAPGSLSFQRNDTLSGAESTQSGADIFTKLFTEFLHLFTKGGSYTILLCKRHIRLSQGDSCIGIHGLNNQTLVHYTRSVFKIEQHQPKLEKWNPASECE